MSVFIVSPSGFMIIPSSPWLLSAIIVIGVALNEELYMIKKYGEEYISYRCKTSFMLPLPRTLVNIILLPIKMIIGDVPMNTRKLSLYYQYICLFSYSCHSLYS